MKTLMIASLLAFSSTAMAKLKPVQTAFWQTVYEDSFRFELKNSNREIGDLCKQLDSYIWDENGEKGYVDAQSFEFLNSLPIPGDMINRSFYIEYKLDIPANLLIVNNLGDSKEVQAFIQDKAKSDLLPLYTQMPTEMRLSEQSFGMNPSIQKSEKSLLSIADEIGLKIRPLKMARRGTDAFLMISDKAVACDLLLQRASLNLKAKGEVKILFDNQMKLTNIYNEYEKLTQDAFTLYTKPQHRAAVLGFFFGAEIAKDQTLPRDQIEPRLVKMLTHLFDLETIQPNQNWTDAFGEKVLSVTGTSPLLELDVQIDGPKGE